MAIDASQLTGYAKAIYDLDREADLQEGFEQNFVANNCERVGQYGNGTWFSEKQMRYIRQIAGKHLGDHYVAEMLGQIKLL